MCLPARELNKRLNVKKKFSCRTRVSTVISVGKLHNKENDVRNAQTMENSRGIPDITPPLG